MSRRSRALPPSSTAAYRFADALGVFSLALGAAELLVPTRIAGEAGTGRRLVQLFGLREVLAGLGILCARDPRPWVWARIIGDALDLTTVMAESNPARRGTQAALAAIGVATVLDILCARHLEETAATDRHYDYGDRSGFPKPPDAMRGAGARGGKATISSDK